MSYTKKHEFDEKVVDRINAYIEEHSMSLSKVAEKAGLSYNQLYQVLHKNQLLKLREYLKICNAFGVPAEKFVENIDL